ncbi:hypothetical protein GQ473_04640 [archaeon]|nr:hypothetical protein [archaeon]
MICILSFIISMMDAYEIASTRLPSSLCIILINWIGILSAMGCAGILVYIMVVY